MSTDPKISEKLLVVKGESSLLEKIKEKKANAEMSSIEQATQINMNGVYKIEQKVNDESVEKWMFLETEFVISQENDSSKNQKELKLLGYDELNELKSMIMLVAKRTATQDGQDDENQILEYFIEVFDNVVRLTETFIKLTSKGKC